MNFIKNIIVLYRTAQTFCVRTLEIELKCLTPTLGSYRKNKRLTHLCVRTFTYPTKVSSEQFVCSESGFLEVPELNPGLAPALKVQKLEFSLS